MDKYVGKRLEGRYEIREIIGVGGMAYVYKAYDVIDDRVVAVKILKDEYVHNEEFSRRFKNESKAIAILSHPNIVRVNDVSFGDSLQYIVMEYIDGITLKEYIEQQKVLQWKEVVHFIEQILHALQHAHDKGIVHQDVKPQNIMLLSDGTIKVTDFGIARFSRATVGQSEQGDKAIGSVHYISPEQARAEITDEKSDIYSVGVMMYEMLTGKLPFESDNAVSVAIMQMQSTAARPISINPDIPEGLEEITLKAMQKDPLKRYQSAAEMLYDIDEFKSNPSIRFEYKYFAGADDPQHYQEAFSRIRCTDKRPHTKEREEVKKTTKKKKKNKQSFPLIPVLAGIAGAFVLIALIICFVLFFQNIMGVGDGKENLPVPNLLGRNYEEVKNSGELAKFQIDIIEAYNDDHSAGVIYDQSPPADRQVKEGTLITLYVSKGRREIVLPSIAPGTPEDVARNMLTQFNIKTRPQTDDTIEKGCVIKTSPAGGTRVAVGSDVILYISNGPEEIPPVEIPKVSGKLELENAIKELEDAGFIVLTENIIYQNGSAFKAGTVIEQSPVGGTMAVPGTEVILTVSSGCKDVALEVEMPVITDIAVDVKIYIDGDELVEAAEVGLDLSSETTLTFDLSIPKESYTVTVELSGTGLDDFMPYAMYDIDGKNGKVVANVFVPGFTITVPTTTTTTTETTTTTVTGDETTTTTGDTTTTTTTATAAVL